MGYYLSSLMVYGMAWDDAPGLCYPEDGNGELIEPGEPVGPSGLLQWGQYGSLPTDPGRFLAVGGAPTKDVGNYAQRAEPVTRALMEEWDTIIYVYLTSLGFTDEEIDQMPAPGWLALASWG